MRELAACAIQVLRQLGLMSDMDIDELENLAQRVEIVKHQVRSPLPFILVALDILLEWWSTGSKGPALACIGHMLHTDFSSHWSHIA